MSTELPDSEVVFDMVECLVARGYRVTVSIEFPSGGGLTLSGEPAEAEPDTPTSHWCNALQASHPDSTCSCDCGACPRRNPQPSEVRP